VAKKNEVSRVVLPQHEGGTVSHERDGHLGRFSRRRRASRWRRRPIAKERSAAPDIVAVVDVGYLGGPAHETLTVTWSNAPPHVAAQVLFSQRALVSSGDVAYAAALNPGRLPLGLYRVEATLAGLHRSAWFFVDDPYGPLGLPPPAPARPAPSARPTVVSAKLGASLFCCYPDAGPTRKATKTPPIFMH
jgi:hypothetical protein